MELVSHFLFSELSFEFSYFSGMSIVHFGGVKIRVTDLCELQDARSEHVCHPRLDVSLEPPLALEDRHMCRLAPEGHRRQAWL
jgi:hypothetical protein